MITKTEYVNDLIHEQLNIIENDNDVEIIFACESGSRSWGFESLDSDYDVRFLYRHKPEWYTSLRKSRDVIEKMIPPAGDIPELDLSGWDIRKAFGLLIKSNPALFEWLRSPTVYKEYRGGNSMSATMCSGLCYDPLRTAFHYYHMAKGNYKEYLRKDQVPLKKYLYVIRPLLANKYIQQGHGFPPVLFKELLDHQIQEGLDAALVGAILNLLEEKMAGFEKKTGPRNDILNAFIEHELEYSNPDDLKIEKDHFDPIPKLDEAFRKIVFV